MIKIEMDKKMTVKMIATDMDGTLLDGQGQLDLPRLATILDELEKRDIRFVVATGNEIPRMRLLLGDLVERMTLVVANGARIFEKNRLSMSSFWEIDLPENSSYQCYLGSGARLCLRRELDLAAWSCLELNGCDR